MNKNIIIAILAVVVVVALYAIIPDSKKDAISLTLDFGNGSSKSFYNHSDSPKSAWSLLQQAAAIANLDLRVSKNFYPQKIDGFVNGTENKNWNLYVNDAKQENSPIQVIVGAPDEVVYKFE